MFRSVTMRGVRGGAVVRGYRTAAALRSWTVTKNETGEWSLSGVVEKVDSFEIQRRPLLFTAPRRGGFWCWPVRPDTIRVQGTGIVAQLGPPEF